MGFEKNLGVSQGGVKFNENDGLIAYKHDQWLQLSHEPNGRSGSVDKAVLALCLDETQQMVVVNFYMGTWSGHDKWI